MASAPQLTIGKRDYCKPAIDCLSQCFYDDPVWTYWLHNKTREERIAYQPQLFYHLLQPAAILNSTFIEANDWSSCIVLVDPGQRIDGFWVCLKSGWLRCIWNIGLGAAKRLMQDYNDALSAAKKRHMGSAPYYYAYIAGTLPSQRKQGLSTATLQECIKIADKDKLPIWMEATSALSHSVYSKCGFQTLEILTVGKGSAAENGEAREGGPGLSVWCMVWRPELETSSEA